MTDLAVADPSAAILARPALRHTLHRAVGWALFAAIVAVALVAGLILRRYAWDQTDPIRYVMDIDNAFRQGTQTLRIGYINRYDERRSRPESDGGFMDLDYAPGRLAVATLWTRWARHHFDPPMADDDFDRLTPGRPWDQFYDYARSVHRQYELVRPMLMVNLTGEILSAIAMFFLVRRYTSGKAPNDRPIRGNILGLVAALFFWFNPALIWNAHCWPQWDSWVMPFFLWAVVLACWDWWFCAGLIVATGAMFKGQILFGAPVFVLWPLFQGRLPAVARWIVGLLTAVAAITAVWLVRIPGTNPTGEKFLPGSVNPNAITWLIYLALIFAAIPGILWWRKQPLWRIPVAMVLAAIMMWIIGTHANHTFSLIGFIVLTATAWFVDDRCAKWSWHAKLPLGWLAVALLIYPVYELAKGWILLVVIATIAMGMLLAMAPCRVLPFAAAGWMAGALLICLPVFNSSDGWFYLGFAYGTHHYEKMANGPVDNLPELLQENWGWDNLMDPAITLPKGPTADHVATFLSDVDRGVKFQPGKEIGLPLKYLLVCAWLIAVVLCAMGAAIHDRNRSPRFLAAIVAPWIVFFAVMTQMHQRYLLWGASLSAATAVLSPGYALLHLFLSIVSASQEMQSMMYNPWDRNDHGQHADNAAYKFVVNWHPGVAWAVLLTAAIFVYTAVKWDKRSITKFTEPTR